jgi:hypothetical protein
VRCAERRRASVQPPDGPLAGGRVEGAYRHGTIGAPRFIQEIVVHVAPAAHDFTGAGRARELHPLVTAGQALLQLTMVHFPFAHDEIVARAVWSGRMLKMHYRRAGDTEAGPRKVAPLGLVLKGGVWYLIAQHEKSIRTYRVANIHDAELCDASVVRPRGFDLALHWAKAAREYETGVYRERADVRLSPEGMLLLELLGPHVTEAALRTAAKPDRKGWLRCTLPLESIDFGVRELMRLGDEVEVIGAAVLRAQLAATATRIARTHRARPASRAGG